MGVEPPFEVTTKIGLDIGADWGGSDGVVGVLVDGILVDGMLVDGMLVELVLTTVGPGPGAEFIPS